LSQTEEKETFFSEAKKIFGFEKVFLFFVKDALKVLPFISRRFILLRASKRIGNFLTPTPFADEDEMQKKIRFCKLYRYIIILKIIIRNRGKIFILKFDS